MVFQLTRELVFPDPHYGDPDGLLAVGGDLSVDRLILAYSNGIFIIRKSKNPAKPKRKVQNPAKIGENHNSKRLLKYKSRNIGMIKKSIGSQANPMLFFAY